MLGGHYLRTLTLYFVKRNEHSYLTGHYFYGKITDMILNFALYQIPSSHLLTKKKKNTLFTLQLASSQFPIASLART